MTILETKNLQKVYGSGETAVHALRGVDLNVQRGEFIAVVGTSGSGKFTLLHMLGGLDRPTAGEGMVDGKSIFSLKDEALTIFRRRKIGFIFQNYNLVPVLNVYENIVLPIQLDGNTVDETYVAKIIQILGIESKMNNLPGQLSGGQQQRLCIARALAVEPEVLLMDEPTSALDPISTLKIEELCVTLKEHYTIVIVTHNMQQATRISDRTAFFLMGELIECSETEKLFSVPQDRRTEDYITGRFG